MNRYLSFIFIFTTLFSQKYDDKRIKLGDRGDSYKVWIYFEDKIDNETVNITQKAINRRLRNNVESKEIGWNDIYVSEEYKNEIDNSCTKKFFRTECSVVFTIEENLF